VHFQVSCSRCGARFDAGQAKSKGSLFTGSMTLYCPVCGAAAYSMIIDDKVGQVVGQLVVGSLWVNCYKGVGVAG